MATENLIIFGGAEDQVKEQMANCMVDASYGVLSADNHLGYSQPVGATVAYRDHISLSGVGYDIACGNKAVKTNLRWNDIKGDITRIMDDVYSSISFGIGRKNNAPIDHPVLEKIAHADFEEQRKLHHLATEQLGTVGSGNHYVDLFRDSIDDTVWIGVHFGSRGFGYKTTNGFIALSQGLGFWDRGVEGEMVSAPIKFKLDSALAEDYIAAMSLAGEYAYAGRDQVCNQVLNILKAESVEEVHNHHNFAWLEEHFGEKLWVIRKGCTPALPGQRSFIGSNMRDVSVIVEGVDSDKSKEALYTTVHGAGRILGRRKAAGTFRRKQGQLVQTKPGLVDWAKAKQEVVGKGVELRGAGPDEAPECYKNLQAVLKEHEGTIKVQHKLIPVGVAMAGMGEFDPYKD